MGASDGRVELSAGAGGRSWQQAAREGPPHTYHIPGLAVSGTLAVPMVMVPSPCMRLQGAVGMLRWANAIHGLKLCGSTRGANPEGSGVKCLSPPMYVCQPGCCAAPDLDLASTRVPSKLTTRA